MNALVGRPGRPAYAAAKAGLAGLARQLAVEYGPEVRVNVVIAGAILTPPWRSVPDSRRQASAAGTAAKRLGDPDEVAAAVAFLASDEASYITGVELPVDGGGASSRTWDDSVADSSRRSQGNRHRRRGGPRTGLCESLRGSRRHSLGL